MKIRWIHSLACSTNRLSLAMIVRNEVAIDGGTMLMGRC